MIQLGTLESWGISAQNVIGHSSGEIAAACAAGLLTPEDAIKIAFYRGQAAKDLENESNEAMGMMAVGLGANEVEQYISDSASWVAIACYNSPHSVTLSGKTSELEKVKSRLQADSHFARLLQVNLAYHSKYMYKIGEHYERLLRDNVTSTSSAKGHRYMYSTVTGSRLDQTASASYWKTNMVSPVRFDQACRAMLTEKDGPNFLIELGPSGALAGPFSQIRKELQRQGSNIQYIAAAKRGPDSAIPVFDVAGRLFISGGHVDFAKVNEEEHNPERPVPATIVDLPNYKWNHSTRYWHESEASKDWRFRPFVHHDLLGSKILGTPWNVPIFKKSLNLKDVPWLNDHKMGTDTLFPASGYISMAVEAIYQCMQSTSPVEGVSSANQLRYRLRNVKFDKALVLEDDSEAKIMLTLSAHPGTKGSWHDFRVFSLRESMRIDHCEGLIRLEKVGIEGACLALDWSLALTDMLVVASEIELAPLKCTSPGHLWYKALTDVGYGFGPEFQKQLTVESMSGQRKSRSLVSLIEPASAWSPQSPYPMHPACIDGCFQTVAPSLWAGEKSAIDAVLIPAVIDDLIINPMVTRTTAGLSVTNSEYTGKGRQDEARNYLSNCSVFDPETGSLLLKLGGLRYHKLDTAEGPHAAHTYNSSVWKPDITFLTNSQLSYIEAEENTSKLNHVIDLVAHKKPGLKIMEVNLSPIDLSCIWLQAGDKSARSAYQQYVFVSADPNTLISVQAKYETRRKCAFSLLDIADPQFTSSESDFDLVIIKRPTFSQGVVLSLAKTARNMILNGGYLLFVEQGLSPSDSDSDESDTVIVNGQNTLDSDWCEMPWPPMASKIRSISVVIQSVQHTCQWRINLMI